MVNIAKSFVMRRTLEILRIFSFSSLKSTFSSSLSSNEQLSEHCLKTTPALSLPPNSSSSRPICLKQSADVIITFRVFAASPNHFKCSLPSTRNVVQATTLSPDSPFKELTATSAPTFAQRRFTCISENCWRLVYWPGRRPFIAADNGFRSPVAADVHFVSAKIVSARPGITGPFEPDLTQLGQASTRDCSQVSPTMHLATGRRPRTLVRSAGPVSLAMV
mmetsp:Transcript_12949/g.20959  ORF Transcript_12949/g.20959 Transcript_12949/m.20959 type:complete len:220 (-) Transcript_12949:702-1361(-)